MIRNLPPLVLFFLSALKCYWFAGIDFDFNYDSDCKLWIDNKNLIGKISRSVSEDVRRSTNIGEQQIVHFLE
jgi:hypothetical protein